MLANCSWDLTRRLLILLMWRIGWAPNNVSKWQVGFNSTFTYPATLILLMWKIGWAPNNVSKWQVGFNSAFTYPATLILLMWRIGWANNVSKWQVGFNSTTVENWITYVHPYGITSELVTSQAIVRAWERPRATWSEEHVPLFHNDVSQ
jgi:hypothetical protein